MPRFYLNLLLSLVIAGSASGVTMAWTPIGNPGNACDLQSQGCFGAVNYAYSIGTYEVTNAQYAEFLNAKAVTDPLGLYNPSMGSGFQTGGITRSGISGSYAYSVIAGRGDQPVDYVSLFDAMRFANWMSNGQGAGNTETGSYTLLGGTATPSNGATVVRSAAANIVLPTENEWYKAAYYSPSDVYFDYPAGSDTQIVCSAPTATANRANCNNAVFSFTNKGSYAGSTSPYGTFDQGGNIQEWNETIIGATRGLRGGNSATIPSDLGASTRFDYSPSNENYYIGFRVAMVPEPSTGLLVMAGLLGISMRRRASA